MKSVPATIKAKRLEPFTPTLQSSWCLNHQYSLCGGCKVCWINCARMCWPYRWCLLPLTCVLSTLSSVDNSDSEELKTASVFKKRFCVCLCLKPQSKAMCHFLKYSFSFHKYVYTSGLSFMHICFKLSIYEEKLSAQEYACQCCIVNVQNYAVLVRVYSTNLTCRVKCFNCT